MSIQKLLSMFAIASAVGFAAVPASAVELVTNGGFETGNFSGWTTSGPTGSPQSCQTNWTVATTGGAVGCGGDNPGNPFAGTYAAYTANDGAGPLTYSLSQIIADPSNAIGGTLTFDWTADTADANRKFTVLLAGIQIFSSTSSTNDLWTQQTIDVTSILAANKGSAITLEFDNYIPASYTGCCNGLGLDAVSLKATVPEPASIAILGGGLAFLGFVRRRRQA